MGNLALRWTIRPVVMTLATLLLAGTGISLAPSSAEAKLTGAACRSAWTGYRADWAAHARRQAAYWRDVQSKRSLRSRKRSRGQTIRKADYVLTYPADYSGRAKPDCADPAAKPRKPSKKRKGLPVVADFLDAALKSYGFVPYHVSDSDFMLRYAEEALALGLQPEQVVGVYALETGGLGPYFRQSGIFNTDQECRPRAPKGRAASTALGYAQLLSANSSAMLHKHGNDFAKELDRRAQTATPARARHLRDTANVVRRMVRDIGAYVRRQRNRNNWREYVRYGKTQKGLAVHAMNLDVDIGPMIQTQKLKMIVDVARRKGHTALPAADLELLNLAGYGRGLEMLQPLTQDVPTSNFFSELGYTRNPVVKGRSASQLRAKLAEIINRKKKFCGSVRFFQAFEQARTGRRADLGGQGGNGLRGPIVSPAQAALKSER